ncbi:MAG: GDSL-type esterase/lipase family protein [Vicinamibacterales bacterium]|nr:GDSL-type esterase/lipase family protein [Vicinamibacterales bacterium]
MSTKPFLMSCRSSGRGAMALMATLLVAACSSPTAPTPQAPPPPVLSLTCPADIARESSDGSAVNVTWPTIIPTGGVNPITVACGGPSDNMFPVGETAVVCRASDTSLQQASCTFTVTVTRQPRLNRVNIMAFGDSMTLGVVSDPQSSVLSADGFPSFILDYRPQASYPTRLQIKLRERYVAQGDSVRVSNFGLSGEKVEDGVVRLSGALANQRPEVLLLLHGANNMTGPFPNSRSFIMTQLSDMMKDARFRGTRVFVATQPPPRQGGRNAIPLSSVLDLNHHIRLLAAGEGAVLVDVYGALNQDINRYMGIDGLHPTEAGYQRMADEFYEAIKADLEIK